MTTNRPYMYELATLLRAARLNNDDESDLREVATRNGIDLDELDEATGVIDQLVIEGADLDEWVRREYISDGKLQGWLSPHASFDDPALTTWKLSQYAYEHYNSPPQR